MIIGLNDLKEVRDFNKLINYIKKDNYQNIYVIDIDNVLDKIKSEIIYISDINYETQHYSRHQDFSTFLNDKIKKYTIKLDREKNETQIEILKNITKMYETTKNIYKTLFKYDNRILVN